MSGDRTYVRALRERMQRDLARVEAWLATPNGGDADTYLGRLSDARDRAFFERYRDFLRGELSR